MLQKKSQILVLAIISIIFLTSCKNGVPGADAKKFPPDPRERVKRNLEEGRGFRLDTAFKKGATNFEFASSNELWRATLDSIDFMPLLSANYSGGIIITDWYSENSKDYVKLTLRFLSNEIRSDAISIKVFYKSCKDQLNCKTFEKKGELEKELKKQILKKAAIYKKQTKDKNFKPYTSSTPGD
tara:strand:+ start:83 stop:634 length:552 start_codon:yes stop_codon:yes gene_type:complete